MGFITKAPICSVCLKSGILCQGCERRLRENKISELDIKISRVLFELAQKYRGLNAINFKRAIDAMGLTVLVVGRGEISSIIGRGGKLIRELAEHLQMKIRVIEEGADIRKQAQDILTPVRVIGVNILYTGGRREEYRVRIPRAHVMRLPASIDAIQSIFAKLTDKNIKLVFE